MALRDQPYFPLYVQDIMTDEKLNECSASTHGIYIKGIMCLMHKSEQYGKLLLKQKYKQNKSMSLNFANQLLKHLPYSKEEIRSALDELLDEKVCFLDGDYLCQPRMIKDNDISLKRSSAGKKGGGNPNFVKTKSQTNSEDEIEYVNIDSINKEEISEKEFEVIRITKALHTKLRKKAPDDYDIKHAKWGDWIKKVRPFVKDRDYTFKQFQKIWEFIDNDKFWDKTIITLDSFLNNFEKIKTQCLKIK